MIASYLLIGNAELVRHTPQLFRVKHHASAHSLARASAARLR